MTSRRPRASRSMPTLPPSVPRRSRSESSPDSRCTSRAVSSPAPLAGQAQPTRPRHSRSPRMSPMLPERRRPQHGRLPFMVFIDDMQRPGHVVPRKTRVGCGSPWSLRPAPRAALRPDRQLTTTSHTDRAATVVSRVLHPSAGAAHQRAGPRHRQSRPRKAARRSALVAPSGASRSGPNGALPSSPRKLS